jgi:hypothetical protein
VIECDPRARLDVVKAATPETRGTVANDVVPSRNCTVPVAEAGKTVAVRTTFAPMVAGLLLDESAVAVDPVVTVSEAVAEINPFVAVIVLVPAATAVASPLVPFTFETVATPVWAEDHVDAVVTTAVLLSL